VTTAKKTELSPARRTAMSCHVHKRVGPTTYVIGNRSWWNPDTKKTECVTAHLGFVGADGKEYLFEEVGLGLLGVEVGQYNAMKLIKRDRLAHPEWFANGGRGRGNVRLRGLAKDTDDPDAPSPDGVVPDAPSPEETLTQQSADVTMQEAGTVDSTAGGSMATCVEMGGESGNVRPGGLAKDPYDPDAPSPDGVVPDAPSPEETLTQQSADVTMQDAGTVDSAAGGSMATCVEGRDESQPVPMQKFDIDGADQFECGDYVLLSRPIHPLVDKSAERLCFLPLAECTQTLTMRRNMQYHSVGPITDTCHEQGQLLSFADNTSDKIKLLYEYDFSSNFIAIPWRAKDGTKFITCINFKTGEQIFTPREMSEAELKAKTLEQVKDIVGINALHGMCEDSDALFLLVNDGLFPLIGDVSHDESYCTVFREELYPYLNITSAKITSPKRAILPTFATQEEAVKWHRDRIKPLQPFLNERTRRLHAAIDVRTFGIEHILLISYVYEVSESTVRRGLKLVDAYMKSGVKMSMQEIRECRDRVRGPGGGRKSIYEKDPKIKQQVLDYVSNATYGDPETTILYTSKSLQNITEYLKLEYNKSVSRPTVRKILLDAGYSLQSIAKVLSSSKYPHRDEQFKFIEKVINYCMVKKVPLVSVDTKNKILVGKFSTKGTEWHKKGCPEKANDHDFRSDGIGMAVPYGVYDPRLNRAFVNIGKSHDTAEFAVHSIFRWWEVMGNDAYPDAKELMILCDCGGSNGYRVKQWKVKLQELANKLGLKIFVIHYPPGASKWNKIEHKVFSFMSKTWRGKLLDSYEVILNFTKATKTATGLKIDAEIDERIYETGIKIDQSTFDEINITYSPNRPELNYVLNPQSIKEAA
jgi:hypothetical protein